ncbi:DUF2207 family protein [Peptoniphilus rhinitidis]|uniref:DUF2207 family protein n=1 Tax=Peptoniphilus rhinitidis TaxID=1175452 RepID=UPI000288E91A|nr:DUF2207 domain-containing protein [Peptoniphilus rhinitidis]
MNLKMNFSSTYFLFVNIILIILSIIMITILKNKKVKNIKDNSINLKYYEKGYLYKGANFIYNTIIAMILKIYGEGNLEIEKNNYVTKSGENKKEYILKNVKKPNLCDAEKKIMGILFSFGNGEISTRTLDKIRRTEPDSYNKKFNDFIYFMENKMVEKKLFSKEKKTFKMFLAFVIFSLLFFTGTVTVYNENFWGAISIIFSIICYAFFVTSFSKMTELGNQKFRELEKIEKDLLNYKVNVEDATILAISFGLTTENIKKIYENSKESGYEIFFEDDFYKTFKTSFVGDSLLTRN